MYFNKGKLDYNASGIILLTNNPEYHSIVESAGKKYLSEYIIKVHGRFTEEKY